MEGSLFPIYLRLCGNPGYRSQKMILGTSLPEFNPEKFPLLEPNCLVGGRIAQISIKMYLFRSLGTYHGIRSEILGGVAI